MNDYIVVAVCTFAVTYLLKYTDGPLDIFARIRRAVKLELPILEDNEVVVDYAEQLDPDTFFAKLFACWWCLSTWIGLIISIFYTSIVYISVENVIFMWIFSIGLAGFMHEILEK